MFVDTTRPYICIVHTRESPISKKETNTIISKKPQNSYELMWCNYLSAAYRLVYHEVCIRAFTFLQTVKGQPLLNYFTLETIYISPYTPIHLCGSVLLVPPPEEPSGSLYPLLPCTHLLDCPPCNLFLIFFLPPPHELPYYTDPYEMMCFMVCGTTLVALRD